VLLPLLECTEIPPVLATPLANLKELVSSCYLLGLSDAEDDLLAKWRRLQRDAGRNDRVGGGYYLLIGTQKTCKYLQAISRKL